MDELEQQMFCLPCAIGRLTGADEAHLDCLGRGATAVRLCGCDCPWLKEELRREIENG